MSYSKRMATLKDLPVEVLSYIMRFLAVPDRKEMALVNKTWYEASLDPVLQKDIVINMQTFLNNDCNSMKTHRRAANMVLDGLGDNDKWVEPCKQFGTSLMSLSVRGCDITEGTFVIFLSHCYCLTSLDLTGCNSLFMTGKFLEKDYDQQLLRKSLANVKELRLASVRYLSNETFNRLVSVLGKLEKLDLSCCPVLFHSSKATNYANGTLFTFENVLDYIKKDPRMKSLALSKTGLTDGALCSLATIPDLKLKSLDLSYCRDIGNKGLKTLCAKQNQIEHLNLTGCPEIGDVVVEEIISNLDNLKDLALKNCSFVTDKSVKKLSTLKSLRTLNLAGVHRPSHTGLTNGLGSNLSSLVYLCLSGNSAVNDSVVISLCLNLRNLRSLDLSSCFYITDQGLVAIFYYLSKLRELNLAHCKKVTDLGLLGLKDADHDHDHLESACKCVRRQNSPFVFQLGIKLDDIPNITLQQVEELQSKVESEVAGLNNLTSLTNLNLQGIANISDLSLTQALHLPTLKVINLNMCSRVTDNSLFSIAEKNPNLEEIYMSSCAVSDLGVQFLVKTLPRLRVMVISNNDQITDATVTAIGNHCRRLRCLDVSFCGNVSELAMEYLDELLPQLHEVHKRYIKTE